MKTAAPDPLDLWEALDQSDLPDLSVHQDLKDNEGYPVKEVHQEVPDPEDPQDLLDHKDSLDHRDNLDLQDLKVTLEPNEASLQI